MGNVKNEAAKKNPPYLKSWDTYSKSVKDKRKPLLMPIKLGLKNGKFTKERMNAKDVKILYAKGRKSISEDWSNNPKLLPNPETAVKHYLHYFRHELNENPLLPPNPLDLVFERPIFLMFAFDHNNWRFTKDEPYRVHNDEHDHTRNFFHVATMNSEKGLMLLNRHYSNPKGLKFDLCVDIRERASRRYPCTPIIIDPGSGNPGHSFP